MRLTKLGALALAAEIAHGYLDTSPFFMFSTSELLVPTTQLQTAASVTSDISLALSQCPSELYYILSQPGVHSSDYSSVESVPTLFEYMAYGQSKNPLIRSLTSVSDVIGEIDSQIWQNLLQSKCGVQISEKPFSSTDSRQPRLVHVRLPAPSNTDSTTRSADLLANDDVLLSLLMASSKNFTVLYTTTPGVSKLRAPQAEKEYEVGEDVIPKHQDHMHGDLKRDLSAAEKVGNQTIIDGPLFAKYQFLSPGIFMGYAVGFLLLLILYVAISGVSSLQVTYAAFDKESGPLAGKKTQ